MTSAEKAAAYLAGAATVTIYAVQLVAARFSLREALSPSDMTILRFVAAGLLLAPLMLRSKAGSAQNLTWLRAATLALLAGVPYVMVINWGLTYAPASHAASLCPASIVICTFALSCGVLRQRAAGTQVFGAAVLVAGLLLFVSPETADARGALAGDLLFIGSGLMFSSYAILVRQWNIDAVMATGAVSLLSCLPLPFLYMVSPSGFHAASLTEIGAQFVIQGLLAGALALLLYTYVVRQLGPRSASLFMPSIPVAASALGFVVLGEVPAPVQQAGIAMIVVGIALQTGAIPRPRLPASLGGSRPPAGAVRASRGSADVEV